MQLGYRSGIAHLLFRRRQKPPIGTINGHSLSLKSICSLEWLFGLSGSNCNVSLMEFKDTGLVFCFELVVLT